MKQPKDVDDTLARVKDEKCPVQNAVQAKTSGFFKQKPNKILFPNSKLFKRWGRDLSEAEQKEVEDLFHKFGYNVYRSDQMPLDRTMPDTRDPR